MASGAVLVNEICSVLGCHKRCQRCGSKKDSLGELHVEKDCVVLRSSVKDCS